MLVKQKELQKKTGQMELCFNSSFCMFLFFLLLALHVLFLFFAAGILLCICFFSVCLFFRLCSFIFATLEDAIILVSSQEVDMIPKKRQVFRPAVFLRLRPWGAIRRGSSSWAIRVPPSGGFDPWKIGLKGFSSLLVDTPRKFNQKPLKIDDWKISFLLGASLFLGANC